MDHRRRSKVPGEPPGTTGQRPVLPGILLALLLSLFTAIAQEKVIIPYDATKPFTTQQPDQRYVPYERFLELWDAAKARKEGPKPTEAPAKYVLDSARYEAVLDGKVMQITATIDFHTFSTDWVEIPLEFGDRRWTSVTVQGAPASYVNNKLVINTPGAHRVILASTEPFLAAENREWSMQIPQTAASSLIITLPAARGVVTFPNNNPSVERIENGRKIISTVPGRTNQLQASIDLQSVVPVALVEPDSAAVVSQITSNRGWEQIVTTATFDLAGSTLDHFSLFFPADCQPVALNGANIRSWKIIAEPGRQRLDVSLTLPASQTYSLELVSERLLGAGTRTAPVISAAARKVERRVELRTGTGMEISNVQAGEGRQVGSERRTTGFFAAYALARVNDAIGYEVREAEVEREARINTVYQVSRRKIEVIASMVLTSSGFLADATIPVPEDFDLETVQSASLRDWWRDGNVVHVRFNPATGPVPLVLYLVKQFDAAPASLDLFPLSPDGFAKVTGEAVIAAHMGEEAALTLTGSAKQIAFESAAPDFSILAPLERKRAFSYRKPDFSGKVTLSPVPLKLGAAWVTHVQAHEGWLGWQTKARIVVRQGSTRSVQFSLPADLPNARVTGPEVRETSSRIDPQNAARRIYTVALQNDLVTSADLTIDLEQSAGQPVAALEFANLEIQDGYLAAENVSDYEMALAPRGLDVAQSADLPFLPPLTTGASLFRLRPGWSLGVTMQRLEKTGSRAAFVAWAEITTAIREDGTEWNRIVWHLQNRSLQFLPVRLPAGGQLIGCRVAGENVRADEGEIDGRKVTLIPLVKTRPGDISYDVEMVWRRSGSTRLGWLTARTLDDPDLAGITVERTLWNLHLPEKHPLPDDPDRVGNMDAVIAEVNKTEKLSGMLEELKSLNSFVSSRSESYASKAKAKENFYRLAKDLEDETREPEGRSDYDSKPAAKPERSRRQMAEVDKLQKELKDSLAGEKQKQLDQPAIPGLEPQQAAPMGQAWGYNNEYAKNSTAVLSKKMPATPPPLGQNDTANAAFLDAGSRSSQLLLNDGVVLNNVIALQNGQKRHAEIPQASADSADKRATPSTEAGNAPQEQIVLGSARGNALAMPALDVQSAQAAPASRRPEPEKTPASRLRSTDDQNQPIDKLEETQVRQKLGVKGRVSLETGFPLEGQVFHFKKLKANARLEFRVGSTPLVERWQRIGWFALAAVGLFSVGRWRRTPG